MVITARAGGLGWAVLWDADGGHCSPAPGYPWSWALQLLPAWSGQCWAREDPKGDPAALLPKSWDCSLHAGVVVGKRAAGELERAGKRLRSSSLRGCGSRTGRTL